jgi:hypothetical protein
MSGCVITFFTLLRYGRALSSAALSPPILRSETPPALPDVRSLVALGRFLQSGRFVTGITKEGISAKSASLLTTYVGMWGRSAIEPAATTPDQLNSSGVALRFTAFLVTPQGLDGEADRQW